MQTCGANLLKFLIVELLASQVRRSKRQPCSNASATYVHVQDWRQKLISHAGVQRVLLVAVVLGVGLIMGDGVLTPAISVVSAIEGLQTGIPSISRGKLAVPWSNISLNRSGPEILFLSDWKRPRKGSYQ